MRTLAPLIAVGTVLAFTSAEEVGQNRVAEEASAAEFTDYRRFDAILSLIERDLKVRKGADQRVGNRPALEGLAETYRKLAESKDREAQFKLGAMYLEGLGVRANYSEAAHWFTQVGGEDHPLVHLANGRFHLKCRDDDARDGRCRKRTIRALGRIGPAASPVIPLLEQEILREGRNSYTAAIALGFIGKAAVPVLIRALGSRNVIIRRGAVEGLRDAGTAALDAIPALTKALQDEDPTVRRYAEASLKQLHSAKDDK